MRLKTVAVAAATATAVLGTWPISSGAAVASSEQACVKAGTARPDFPVKPVMWHAGIRLGDPRHLPYQLVRGTIAVPAMPEGCAPRYKRIMSGKLFMQDSADLSHWRRPILGDEPGHAGNTPLTTPFLEWSPSAWPDAAYNACVDGHWLKVKYEIDMQVKDMSIHRYIAHREYTVPVPVKGSSCASAAISKRWADKAFDENARSSSASLHRPTFASSAQLTSVSKFGPTKITMMSTESPRSTALAASSATTGSEAECAPKILAPPSIRASIGNPGNPASETLGLKLRFEPVDGCDNWQRIAVYRFQQKVSGNWIGKDTGGQDKGNYWYPVLTPRIDGSDTNQVTTADAGGTAMHHPDICVDSRRLLDRVEERSYMKSVGTGKIAAKSRIKVAPVTYEHVSEKRC